MTSWSSVTSRRQAVYDAADRAERTLAMPVNPVIRTTSAWQAGTDRCLPRSTPAPTSSSNQTTTRRNRQRSTDDARQAITDTASLITAAEQLLGQLTFFNQP